MKTLIAVLALSACGNVPIAAECPSPFGSMEAEAADGCFDPSAAVAIVKAAGLDLNLGSVQLTVRDVYYWHDDFQGDVSGLTTAYTVTVGRGGASLAHELLHVTERPHLSNHELWATNGFYALVNLEGLIETGSADAWGYGRDPCVAPTMPTAMVDNLRAAGYPVDAFLESAACKP